MNSQAQLLVISKSGSAHIFHCDNSMQWICATVPCSELHISKSDAHDCGLEGLQKQLQQHQGPPPKFEIALNSDSMTVQSAAN
mmetsp:Transcript_50753/g.99460  ORF Transcript_50753/g.99460 Transcript_50753/m.99460 type:complete len:83 (-) Transcript_50753:157-405(-)